MSEDVNPSIAAVVEEIRVRTQELEALRAALDVLRSDRQPQVQIVTGSRGQLAINNVFTDPAAADNGNSSALDSMMAVRAKEFIEAAEATVREERKTKKSAASGRASTARLLALFDRQRARSLADVATEAGVPTRHIAIGVLLKHGYLKAKGEGYVRTAKDYVP